uniref:Transposable element Tc3 transposase-like DNA-binding HTH domain-containing protein n=1 Tax=Caenorhabditis japonica TaxID=281687 RepID=A0A8R1IVW5_CAEJA
MGRGKPLTDYEQGRDKRTIVRKASNAVTSCAKSKSDLDLNVSSEAVGLVLKKSKFIKHRKMKKAPFLTAVHKQKRLEFARKDARTDWRKKSVRIQRKIDMSLRQAEKDVELEVGHVEEKNVVVEVVESVTGGEIEERLGAEWKVSVRDRRKLVKGFAQWLKTIEQVSEKVEKDLVVLTKCTKRQREGIIGPLKEFASELLERFGEMGADRWPRSVLRVKKDFDLENVQEIRQVFKKVFGEACSEANESKDAEKVDKIDRKYQKLKIKLSDCQINSNLFPGNP